MQEGGFFFQFFSAFFCFWMVYDHIHDKDLI